MATSGEPLPTVHEEPSLQAKPEELALICVVCGADNESYSAEGVASCEEHLPREETPWETSMDSEQFMSIVLRIAAVWPSGCTVHVDPPGSTLDEHVRHRRAAKTGGRSSGDAGAVSAKRPVMS
jgi:hypothetical protein